MPAPNRTAVAVNPSEGQVAIPVGGGHVVGRLAARAMRWVEEATGRSIDDIYVDFARRAALAERATRANRGGDSVVGFPVTVACTVIWAAVEHERRHLGLPGPEWTIEDTDAVVDAVGLDDAYSYALALIQLSAPFRKRTEEMDRLACEAGEASPLDELRRVAAGTGTPMSPGPSDTASASTTSGD